MILSDAQLQFVMQTASRLPPEKRAVFLQRAVSLLRLRGRFIDRDVTEATAMALRGLPVRDDDDTAA